MKDQETEKNFEGQKAFSLLSLLFFLKWNLSSKGIKKTELLEEIKRVKYTRKRHEGIAGLFLTFIFFFPVPWG